MDLDLSTLATDAGLIAIVVAIMTFVKAQLPNLTQLVIVALTIAAGVVVLVLRVTVEGAFDDGTAPSEIGAVIIAGAYLGLAAAGLYTGGQLIKEKAEGS